MSKTAAAALLVGAALLCPADEAESTELTVRLTVYLDRGVMYSGYQTHWGAGACSWNLPLGTVLELPDGHQVTCLDRGRLGDQGWLDIWCPDWETAVWMQRRYGDWAAVQIVRWGW